MSSMRIPNVLPLGVPVDHAAERRKTQKKHRVILIGALGGAAAFVSVTIAVLYIATRPPAPPEPVVARETPRATEEPASATVPAAEASAPVAAATPAAAGEGASAYGTEGAAADAADEGDDDDRPRARGRRGRRGRAAGRARPATAAAAPSGRRETRPRVVIQRRAGDALSRFGL